MEDPFRNIFPFLKRGADESMVGAVQIGTMLTIGLCGGKDFATFLHKVWKGHSYVLTSVHVACSNILFKNQMIIVSGFGNLEMAPQDGTPLPSIARVNDSRLNRSSFHSGNL
jgi:hypothetical protein